MNSPVIQTNIPGLPVRRGKVRDIYDLGNNLLLVATDRISAFDWVLPTGIPDKGAVLNIMSSFWFNLLQQPHHCLSVDINDIFRRVPTEVLPGMDRTELTGRCMLAQKTRPVLVECVVRGYLDGSGWKEYQQSGTVCGLPLPPGLKQCDQLPEPIFTPATKEASGHDINISFERMCEIVGEKTAQELRQRSLGVYQAGAAHALERGVLIADTKLEFGILDNKLILIDEILTPDSSRFWPVEGYEPGRGQMSFDKQFVRNWLTESGWDKNSPPPELPPEIVAKTREKYLEAYNLLTGKPFPWK